MGTLQDQMKATLKKTGLPYKEIEVYGRQIVVTCWSRDAADKWSHLLARFAKVRGITHDMDEAKQNKGTVMRPTMIEVWRTFAAIV